MTIDLKVATLKKKIEEEMNNENYDKVEALSEELCRLQELDTDHKMPSDFVMTLKRKERKNRTMRMKNKLVKAAAIMVVLGMAGGTVYAGSQYFKPVKQTEYGMEVSDDDINVVHNSDGSIVAGDVPEETLSEEQKKAMDNVRENGLNGLKEDDVEVLETAKPGENDKWLSKKVSKITSYDKSSDDGINWEDDSYIRMSTDYEYKDLATACEDQGMKKIFNKNYEQSGNTLYNYSELPDEKGNVEDEARNANIKATLKYKNGTCDIDYSKYFGLGKEDSAVENRNLYVITGDKKASNQREYTSESGETYSLSDNVVDNEKVTTVVLSRDEYDCVLSFRNLSDKEIHEMLDTVIAE